MKNPLAFIVLASALSTCVTAAQPLSKRIDHHIAAVMKAHNVPGLSLAVIKDGKVIKSGVYGLANLNFDVPVKSDTRFLLASLTKQFTAAGIMVLVQDGKIGLDDPISKYLSDTPDVWKGITVRNLLTHTAGLKDRFESSNALDWLLTYTTSAMYVAAKKTPPDFAPGQQWQYSDQGYFLLGMIIERVSGEAYDKFLKERLFKPLGMNDTAVVNQNEIQKNLASGYRSFGAKLLNNRRSTEYGVVSHFGMISTISDLAKWDAALDTNQPLSAASKKMMWTEASLADGSTVNASTWSYGFGWFLGSVFGHRVVQHSGSTGTAMYRLPDDKITVIVLTNLDLFDAPGVASDIASMLVPDLAWMTHKPANDPNPSFTSNLKAELIRIAGGKSDPVLYTEAFGKGMAAAAPTQKAVFAQMGPLSNLDYLATDIVGNNRLLRYRAVYKNLTVDYSVTLNRDNRVANLGGEPEGKS
jgi:CubicO group peptidase (beta-lactamase class C family)